MRSHINLLPIGYRRGQLVRLRLRSWVTMWIVAAATVALVFWTQWTRYQASAARLESMRREYVPLERMEKDVQGIQTRIADLQRRESLALSLADERSLLGMIGLLRRAAEHSGGATSINRLRLERKGGGHDVLNTLTLDGVAVDHLAVSRFVGALNETSAFATVQLKSTGDSTVGDKAAKSYSLECVY